MYFYTNWCSANTNWMNCLFNLYFLSLMVRLLAQKLSRVRSVKYQKIVQNNVLSDFEIYWQISKISLLTISRVPNNIGCYIWKTCWWFVMLMLLLYIAELDPFVKHISLASVVVKAYVSTRFGIKNDVSCKDGGRHTLEISFFNKFKVFRPSWKSTASNVSRH